MNELQEAPPPVTKDYQRETRKEYSLFKNVMALLITADDAQLFSQQYMKIRINGGHQLFMRHGISFVGFNSVSLSKAGLILLHTH